MILNLNVHFSRVSDLLQPDHIRVHPSVPIVGYRDAFGNWCSRLAAPAGELRISTDRIIEDSGLTDVVDPLAVQHPVEELPAESLVFLLGSHYCETDRLSETAWSLFETSPQVGHGCRRPATSYTSTSCFGYEHARPTKTALEAFHERTGVCRDFTHLAITFCRCMNIPVRYCTGYLGDIGVPPAAAPMDFSAWMEVYRGGRWHVLDPRNNAPRIGRVLIAQGRDAAYVALSNAFGPADMAGFNVWTDEIPSPLA